MSSSIWTRCAGISNAQPLRARAIRVVESQHHVSTRRLVDDLDEQALLEELIEKVKPAIPGPLARRGLHYLLFTPFRHPPLRHGSRFGVRRERGIWYGALTTETAFAEVAYYRLLFLQGTRAKLQTVRVDLSAFCVRIAAKTGIDLTAEPFRQFRSRISSKTSYQSTQPLGKAMRADGVEAALFESARCPSGGTNIALIAPVFAEKTPRGLSTWRCLATRDYVELVTLSEPSAQQLRFSREQFLVGGNMPAPGWDT